MRLQRKLNTLIAVLEVACAKVRQTLAGPDPDVERLTRIHKNLKDTLTVCKRAKRALERCEKLPADLPENLTRLTSRDESKPASRARAGGRPHRVEVASEEEAEKFESMRPIDPREIRAIDLDELARQFMEE